MFAVTQRLLLASGVPRAVRFSRTRSSWKKYKERRGIKHTRGQRPSDFWFEWILGSNGTILGSSGVHELSVDAFCKLDLNLNEGPSSSANPLIVLPDNWVFYGMNGRDILLLHLPGVEPLSRKG